MAEVRTEIDLFDSWYRIADVDKDGKVGGNEAVPFLQRSGLSKDALFKIWSVVAGESAFLTKQQFYSAMRLISVAQRSGGKLEEKEARSVLIGIGPPVPPPQMAGLEQLKTPVNQLAPKAPQPAMPPPPKAAGSAVGTFPPMSADAVQRYQAQFAQLDSDHDGWVQGAECFGFMIQWGLGQGVLREIWALVAGDAGQLSTQQFISCLYLMDNAKQGIAPPKRLPGGAFPPIAPAGMQASQASVGGIQGFQDVFSKQIQVPPLPPRAQFTPIPVAAAASQVPGSAADLEASLGYSERQRMAREREEAAELEKKAQAAQTQLEAAKAAQAYFQKALQELTLFKSKTSAALLQAEEWAGREEREAADAQKRYETTYGQAEAQYKGSRTLLASIQAARARKLEAQSKLEGLQKDIERLSSLSGEEVHAEEAQVEDLQQQIARAELERARLDVRGEALRKAAARLEELASGASLALTAADASLMQIDRDYTKLHAEYEAEDSDHVVEIQRLLAVAADTYKGLAELAVQGGTPIPRDGIIPPLPPAACEPGWDDTAVAAAVDWHDFEDDGFKVVIAMPEYNKRAAAAAAAAKAEAAAKAKEEATARAEQEAMEQAAREAEEAEGGEEEAAEEGAAEDGEEDLIGAGDVAVDGKLGDAAVDGDLVEAADGFEPLPPPATSQISSMTRDDDPFAEEAGESASSAVSPVAAVGATLLGKRAEPASAVLAGTAPQRRDVGGAAAVLSTDEHLRADATPGPAAKPAPVPAEDLLAWD